MKLTEFKATIHPELFKKCKNLVQRLEKKGIYIQFSTGLRTEEEQNDLYAQGRTKPGNIVTNVKGSTYGSQHQWGIAIDFYIDMDLDGDGEKKDDAFNNETRIFDTVGKEAESIGLGWGGNWKSFKDRPHLYLINWGSNTSLLKQIYGCPQSFFMQEEFNISVTDTNNKVEGGEAVPFIKLVQGAIGVAVDGIAGPKTLSSTPTLSMNVNNRHKVVSIVQKELNARGHDCGKVDGIFGNRTKTGVKSYQKAIGFKYPDGIMSSGKRTWRNILGM